MRAIQFFSTYITATVCIDVIRRMAAVTMSVETVLPFENIPKIISFPHGGAIFIPFLFMLKNLKDSGSNLLPF